MADPDYFTLAELRALPDVASTSKYPDARCEAAAAYITAVIEREVGTSFVGRARTETLAGGSAGLVLEEPYVLAVTSVTEGGLVLAASGYQFADGVLTRLSGPYGRWASGSVVVSYLAGYSATPPADVKEMALKGTRAHLLASSSDARVDDRRTSINTDLGQINFVVAGPDRPTGYPEVDAMILGWKQRLNVGGFA